MAAPLDPMRALYGSQPVHPVAPTGVSAGASTTADGKTFQDVLSDFVHQADHAQKQYDQAIDAVVKGDTDNLHRVMMAQNEAQVSLKMAVEVRNKLVEAYKEAMRTQF